MLQEPDKALSSQIILVEPSFLPPLFFDPALEALFPAL
jgi:hypothetical protein